jgi:phospholipase/carboxylesterase
MTGMRSAARGGWLWLVVLGLACDKAPSSVPGPPAQTGQAAPQGGAGGPAPGKVDVGPANVDAIHEYTGGAKAGDAVPVVVAIHGLGDRPASFKGLFQGFGAKAHIVFPAGGLPWGDGFAWWPITGHIDEKNMAPGLGAAAERLSAAIAGWRGPDVAGKPIVTGFSQGGMLSFAIAVKHPEIVGESVPVAGLLPPSMTPAAWPAGAGMPRVLALHGDADARVPFALGQRSVEALRALGIAAELRSYPGVQHTVSADMRRDWLAALEAAVARAAGAAP